MEARSVGTAINLVVLAGYAIGAAWTGYRRRRAHWTRGSWIGLGVAVLVGLAMVAFSLVFSAGVDNHEAWVGARGSNTRSGWIVASLVAMVGGSLLVGLSLGWFATGSRTRQFPLFGSLGSHRALPEADRDAERLASGPQRLHDYKEM